MYLALESVATASFYNEDDVAPKCTITKLGDYDEYSVVNQDDDENSGVGSCVRTIKYKLDAQDDERAHASGGGGRCDPKEGVSRVIGDGYADDAAVGLHSKEIPINFVSAEDDEKDLPIALTYHPEDSPNGDGGTTVVLEGELITAITVAALVLVLALAIVMFCYRTYITSIKYCIGCVTAIVLGVFSCFEVSPRRGTFPFFQLPPAFLCSIVTNFDLSTETMLPLPSRTHPSHQPRQHPPHSRRRPPLDPHHTRLGSRDGQLPRTIRLQPLFARSHQRP